jgi:hypothetical protein
MNWVVFVLGGGSLLPREGDTIRFEKGGKRLLPFLLPIWGSRGRWFNVQEQPSQ